MKCREKLRPRPSRWSMKQSEQPSASVANCREENLELSEDILGRGNRCVDFVIAVRGRNEASFKR